MPFKNLYRGDLMKKSFFFAVVLALVCCFGICGQCSAAPNWKVAGTWEFTSNIPEQAINVFGQDYTYSSKESGTVVINMTEDATGTEYGGSYIYFSYGTNHLNGDSNEYVIGPEETAITPNPYVPGAPVTFIASIPIRGQLVTEELTFTQDAENHLTGTVTLTLAGQQVTGTFSAKRTAPVKKNWTIGGEWKYSCKVPAKNIIVDNQPVQYSSSESGTIILSVNEPAVAGQEFLNYYDYFGNGTSVVKSALGTDSKEYAVNVSRSLGGTLYKPGCVYLFDAGHIDIRGYSVREILLLTQVEKNKIQGKVMLIFNNQLLTGPITAVREEPTPTPTPQPSSGGGGCNAGYGALALLLAIPMFRRRK